MMLAGMLILGAMGCSDDDGASGPGDGADGGSEPTDDNDGGGGTAAADLPEQCPTETPFTVPVEGGENLPGIDGPEFQAAAAVASAQPIVPDPDGEMTPEEIEAVAADTDLVSYTIYVADFPLTDSLSSFGVRVPDDGTLLGFTVLPPTEAGLSVGDVVTGGTPEFESVTTFATLGVYYETGTAEDTPNLASDRLVDPGEAEVLHLDDEWICVRWSQGGELFGGDGDGEWQIDTVVAAPIEVRQTLAFT
jgi:hypothetical protein